MGDRLSGGVRLVKQKDQRHHHVILAARGAPDVVHLRAQFLLLGRHARREDPVPEHHAGKDCDKGDAHHQLWIDLGALGTLVHDLRAVLEIAAEAADCAKALRPLFFVGLRHHQRSNHVDILGNELTQLLNVERGILLE